MGLNEAQHGISLRESKVLDERQHCANQAMQLRANGVPELEQDFEDGVAELLEDGEHGIQIADVIVVGDLQLGGADSG